MSDVGEGLEFDRPLERAMGSAMDGMAILDEGGTYLYVNRAHADMYGYDDPDDLVGETWRRLYDEDEAERFETQILPELRETGEWRGEAVGRRDDGETFFQELSLAHTDEGRIVCVVRDITERKRRQEALERYESILENIHDAVYTLDPDGRITWVNETAVEEFDVGYAREDLIGAHVSKVLSQEDIERGMEIIGELLESDERESGRYEVAIQTAYGDEIPSDLHLGLLESDDGEFRGTVGVLRDITERKRREQRLSVLNRVLRHNLRNEMNVLIARLDTLEDELDEAGVEEVRKIRGTVDRMLAVSDKARAVEETLEHSAGEGAPVDVVGIVEERCEAFRESHPEATIAVDAPEERWAIANETLEVVVDNLIENAIEHNDREPTVTVSVSGPDAGEGVEIRVADDGPGIPRGEIDVLIEDRETPLHHGSGLGLWSVHWLVDSYGGSLSFEETPDGSAVIVGLREASPPG